MKRFYMLTAVFLVTLIGCGSVFACGLSKGPKGTQGSETEETGK